MRCENLFARKRVPPPETPKSTSGEKMIERENTVEELPTIPDLVKQDETSHKTNSAKTPISHSG
jgi:hypothetical protein